MRLNNLSPSAGSRRKRKRLGKGLGSGWGKTAGRGTKGSNSRSGGGVRPGFEGGQMPLQRRLPKRGFANIFKKRFAIVNVGDLIRFDSGTMVDEIALVKAGLIKGKRDGIKVLGKGDLDRPLTIRVNGISQSARVKIEKSGGTVEVV